MWILWNKKVNVEQIYGVDVSHLELNFEISKNNLRPSLDFDASDDVKNIMQRCWSGNTKERPTATQLLETIPSWQQHERKKRSIEEDKFHPT